METFSVYALHSPKHSKIYVGYSSNLKERLASHNVHAKKGFTVRFRPWVLVHQEQFPTKREAMIREKQLKSSRGRAFIWELIKKRKKG